MVAPPRDEHEGGDQTDTDQGGEPEWTEATVVGARLTLIGSSHQRSGGTAGAIGALARIGGRLARRQKEREEEEEGQGDKRLAYRRHCTVENTSAQGWLAEKTCFCFFRLFAPFHALRGPPVMVKTGPR
jgi:hypothetical protein